MPNLADTISGFVKGDDLDVRRTIQNVPATQTIAEAWLTIRNTNLSTVVFFKHITPTLVAGQGHITDTGGDGEGAVWFQLTGGTAGDTVQLTAGTAFPFDIQIKTSAGKYYTPVVGTITSTEEITRVD